MVNLLESLYAFTGLMAVITIARLLQSRPGTSRVARARVPAVLTLMLALTAAVLRWYIGARW